MDDLPEGAHPELGAVASELNAVTRELARLRAQDATNGESERSEIAGLREEITRLQAEVRALQGGIRALRMPPLQHGWLKLIWRDLKHNPHAQYRVHYVGMLYWLVNFPLVTLLFFSAPMVWLKWGLYITLIYSIYANFSTDFAGMSAAMAAFEDLPGMPGPEEPPSSA